MISTGFLILGIVSSVLTGVQSSVEDSLPNVSNLDEFLGHLSLNGHDVRPDQIFEVGSGNKVPISGGLMATPDECSPRNVSVRLPLDYSESNVHFFPVCTMMQRCGGCCASETLSCEPIYKERVALKVIKARLPFPGAPKMNFEGFTTVDVEKHITCGAVCRLRSTDCASNQRFQQNKCKCECLQIRVCNANQRWDDATCTCRCINESPCCPEDDLTCPQFYDHRTCMCTLKEFIGLLPSATQQEIEEWYRRDQNTQTTNNVEGSTETTSQSTTTNSSTTNASTIQSQASADDPCANFEMNCPRNFVKRMSTRGRCVCVLARPQPRSSSRLAGP